MRSGLFVFVRLNRNGHGQSGGLVRSSCILQLTNLPSVVGAIDFIFSTLHSYLVFEYLETESVHRFVL